MTVGELMQSISVQELRGWMEFDATCEPIGQRRDDYHTAILHAASINAAIYILNAFSKRQARMIKASDFVPFVTPIKQKQTVAEQKAIFRAIASKRGK